MNKLKISLKRLGRRIGPGVITGAADDDPSGVMTCLIVGAQTGLSLIWTTILTIPLMITIQEMCARIGLATKHGLAGNMKQHLSLAILAPAALLMFLANSFNIAADLSGMVASTQLLIPLPRIVLGIFFTAIILLTMVLFSYKTLAKIFRWLTLPILAYIASALLANLSFKDLLSHTLIPHFQLNKITLMGIVAILGTTISPYLFFWQASEEVEEQREQAKGLKRVVVTKHELRNMRESVTLGMVLSNTVMFFILASGAAAFYQIGITNITTTSQAAQALVPLAGNFSALLFTIGIIGTGILAIPVLAGSAAYVVSESFGWREGLDQKFYQAKMFYGIIILSTILGLLFSLLPFNPIKLLFYTAVAYGLLSPLMILIVIYIANQKAIMRDKVNGFVSNVSGTVTFVIMSVAALSLLFVR